MNNIPNIPNIPTIVFGNNSDPFGGAITNMMKYSSPVPTSSPALSPASSPIPSLPSINLQPQQFSTFPSIPSDSSIPTQIQPFNPPSQFSGYGCQSSAFDSVAVFSEPKFSIGVFSGKTYQNVVDENSGLIQKHDRNSPCPYVCGTRCNLDYNFIKWFAASYKKELYLCNACPWYVIAQTIRFPDDDPKYPGVLFNDVYIKDPGYFQYLPDVGRYISLKGLYRKRLNRATGFPQSMKSKHAGKTFEQVLMSTPDYFKWIQEKYIGKDDVYFDAVDWYLENSHRAPIIEKKQYQPRVLSESASIVDSKTLFESGKYRGKTFAAVYAFDPDYYNWLSTSYRGKSPNMLAAIEWFHLQSQ